MKKKIVPIVESKIIKKYKEMVSGQLLSASSAWNNVTHDKAPSHNQTTHAKTATPPFVNSTPPHSNNI